MAETDIPVPALAAGFRKEAVAPIGLKPLEEQALQFGAERIQWFGLPVAAEAVLQAYDVLEEDPDSGSWFCNGDASLRTLQALEEELAKVRTYWDECGITPAELLACKSRAFYQGVEVSDSALCASIDVEHGLLGQLKIDGVVCPFWQGRIFAVRQGCLSRSRLDY